MSGEITKEHLKRKAYIYIRQSSQCQVMEHTVGREVQYNLVQRAKSLGWPDQNIEIIDEDLGITATGTKERNGFEKVLTNICLGNVGGLFYLYASRLARNGKDWHTMLQLCSVFKVLIIDREMIYDPQRPNDRLWLGMQGSFSEYEGSQMQVRAREAILQKASKGELFVLLPAGFVVTEDRCHVELDPDQRVQQAIAGVFTLFNQFTSVRQVTIWYQQQQLELPVRDIRDHFKLKWCIPAYHTVYRILTNPLYAGIYMYPKTKTITHFEAGKMIKTSGHKVDKNDKAILIYDLFPAYISREQYQRNQQLIRDNTNMKPNTSQGALREGKSILTGLLFCGHCSRKLRVRYTSQHSYPYYFCGGEVSTNIRKGCLSFGGRYLDSLVVNEIIKTLQPQALEAAVLAEKKQQQQAQQISAACGYALEQARYEAQRIERQVNQVDPENHLVFDTLTQRWQQALEKVTALENQYQQLQSQQQAISKQDQQDLAALAADLTKVWYHPQTDARIKKRIVRLLIKEIWVKHMDAKTLQVTIHWQGGVHTEYAFPRRYRQATAPKNVPRPVSIQALIRKLAPICDDQQIARILNRYGYLADNNQPWRQSYVLQFREQYQIEPFSSQEYNQRNLVTLKQAAQMLQVSMATTLQLIELKIIRATQVIKYAPWEIDKQELEKPAVKHYLNQMRKGNPVVYNENQLPIGLDATDVKEQQ